MRDTKLQDRTILVKFIRSKVGLEDKLVESLSKENPNSVYFKVLGRFDILEVSKINSLRDSLRLYSDQRILEMSSFPCKCWKANVKNFWEKLNDSVAPTITLAKLQEPLFLRRGFQGVQKVSEYLSKGDGVDIFSFSGFGYYEIFLFNISNSFEKIFSYIETIRSLTIKDIIPSFSKADGEKALLTNTTTVPLISYKNIIVPKQWQKLEGKVNPIITLKCAPGHEDFIKNKWLNSWNNLLGAEDLICLFENPIPLSNFIKDLITFRKNAIESLMLFNTSTSLFQNFGEKSKSKDGNDNSELKDPPGFDKPPYSLFETLKGLDKLPNSKHFVISELINIVSLLNTYIGNRLLKFAYSDILYSIKYLKWSLYDYQQALTNKNYAVSAEREDDLLCYAESVRSAIAQHFPHEDPGASTSIANIQSFDCSLSMIIKAISVIPEQLFKLISKSPPPPKLAEFRSPHNLEDPRHQSYTNFNLPWKGFLLLRLSENYQIVDQSERLCVPFRDIFNVLNWITLSHEISHAYYVRIDYENLEADYLNEWRELVRSKKPELFHEFDSRRADSNYEFFAHWFDYRHFFNGDLNFYLWSIWRTWVEIPRPYQFREEYWLRSIFVKVSNNWNTLQTAFETIYKSGLNQEERSKQYVDIFARQFTEIDQFIKLKFPYHYDDLKLSEQEQSELFEKALMFKDLVRKFEEDYVNNDLIISVQKPSSNLERDIDRIFEGKTLKTKIENPFLLLKEILKRVYEGAELSDLASLALIYSLRQASRHFRRPSK